MAFSEKVKLIVKKKSCFRCVVCQEPFVEIHHIIPQCEGGDDTEDNAAPLCALCHDLYGENPSKRKQIREMRDHWYDAMERRYNGELDILKPINEVSSKEVMRCKKGIAIYHYVFMHEDFDVSATILFNLIKSAQAQFPNRARHLYLDIEGHKNSSGGYDSDMFELQTEFVLGFLSKYLTEIHTPLYHTKNPKLQSNDVPEALSIMKQPTS
jgi:hypothetical protein